MCAFPASASWLIPRLSRSCAILAATRFVTADSAIVARMLHVASAPVKNTVAFMLPGSARWEITENLVHDRVDVVTSVATVDGHQPSNSERRTRIFAPTW